MSEHELQSKIQLIAPLYDYVLMRNNSGAVTTEDGRHIRFGLGNTSKKHCELIKSSDLIGWREVTITPDMVGTKVPVFTAFEMKKPNWKYAGTKREQAQKRFIDGVSMAGGIAKFISDVDGLINV